MIVPLALFIQIAATCGSSVHVDTLAAVARTESRFDSAAINDNTTHRGYLGLSDAQAAATASRLIAAGHSLDLGLMQVNSANLRGLGLSVAEAIDPCRNIAAGARVLVDGYRRPIAGTDTQPALNQALSHYNTGSPQRGFGNGYVARVLASAEQIVPAIRVAGGVPPTPDASSAAVAVMPSPPPSWDVFGSARAARRRAVAAPLAEPGAAAPPAVPALPPVQLQTINPGAGGAR